MDLSKQMADLTKDAKLPEGEKVTNMYSKQKVKAIKAKDNPLKEGEVYEVHPENAKHLIAKGFAAEIKSEVIKTEAPNLDEPHDPIMIQA